MKIVSGAQTGVDRGALYGALASGFDVGGWCPLGYRAEDGKIPDDLIPHLKQTPLKGYSQRTTWNVRDSDLTVVVHAGAMGPGTRSTIGMLRNKPHVILDIRDRKRAWADLFAAFADHDVKVCNFAGPRETGSPGIQDLTQRMVKAMCERLREQD